MRFGIFSTNTSLVCDLVIRLGLFNAKYEMNPSKEEKLTEDEREWNP